jgi:hypothetical protein
MTEQAKMDKPYFFLIGDFQAVLDIQRELDSLPATGFLYYTDKDRAVREYELSDEEIQCWTDEHVLVRLSTHGTHGTKFANFDELMEKVETSEQEHLMFPKADILVHIANIANFFAGR